MNWQVKTEQDLIDAGKAAAAEGLRLWHLDVHDPAPRFLAAPQSGADAKWMMLHERALRWRMVIDEIHEAAGWGSDTPYQGNGLGRLWCGFTVAKMWREAGIDPKWLAAFFASTKRLFRWAHYLPWVDGRGRVHANPVPKPGEPRRQVMKLGRSSRAADLPFLPREGDIVIIGSDPNKQPEGRHITAATGIDLERGLVTTVEGNGTGVGPDGKERHGIVVGEHAIGAARGDYVMWVYRPATSDLL